MEHRAGTNRLKLDSMDSIFSINEKDMFISELGQVLEEIKRYKLFHIRDAILINFILFKLEELDNTQRKATKLLKDRLKLHGSLNFNMYKEANDYMIEYLLNTMIESPDKICIEKLKNLSGFVNNDTHSQILQRFIEKSTKLNGSCQKNSEDFSNNQIIQSVCYKLRVSYLESSDAYVQNLEINLEPRHNELNHFLSILRKKLGIYEFAKFKILIFADRKGKIWI